MALSRPVYKIRAGNYVLELGKRTVIMGVINMTPDSFSGDGFLKKKKFNLAACVRAAERMVEDGADILDIGGESTRPGSERVAIAEELQRVIPVIERVRAKVNVPISIDSYKPRVIEAALKAGATIVNNINGLKLSTPLLNLVRDSQAAIVLMHMRGNPKTMQQTIRFKNAVGEIGRELSKSIKKCLDIGIHSDRIIIDPGIGFGKTVEQNLSIIHHLCEFQRLQHPILIGTSRKSFIGRILNADIDRRLIGTVASVVAGAMNGAHIVRVHDVAETRQALLITDSILNQKL